MARERRGFFDRPLWRILVPVILVSFALHRVAAAILVSTGDAHPVTVAGYALMAVAAFAVAVLLFRGGGSSEE